MSIDAEYLSHDIIDSYISVQGNTATLTREYMFRLKNDYRGQANAFSTEMDVLSYPALYQDNEIFDKSDTARETFYKNVNFYVTSRSAKAMFKSSTSGEAMDERIWKIVIVFTGEGLNFQHLSTDTVKVIDIETGITPYNFNVTKAYNHPHTLDDTEDELGKPTKIIENWANDPLLEGLTEIRNITYIKLTLDYIGLGVFKSEWKTYYSNVLNTESLVVYDMCIAPFDGMITVEGYKYTQLPPDSAKTRVILHIQIKQSVNGYGGWIQQPLNQGFQAYGLTRAGTVLTKKDKITQGDIAGAESTKVNSATSPVSDPVKLDLNGKILGEDADPIFLHFLVQPAQDWKVLALPEGQ